MWDFIPNTPKQKTLSKNLLLPYSTSFHDLFFLENEFSTTRSEMLEMVKKNELVFGLALSDNTWYIVEKGRYVRNVKNGNAQEHYPLELCY